MSGEIFGLLTLEDIFDSGERRFSVPDYQRGYSWEEEQRVDLIGDIEQIQNLEHRHFTGTVVASRKGDSACFDIVDGQQRITSLVILISCLLRIAKQRNMTEIANISITEIENTYISSGLERGDTCYQLQLGPMRDPLFQDVLFCGKPVLHRVQDKADQNIVNAATQFENWLDAQNDDDLNDTFLAVSNKLGFLLYAPERDAEIGLMFEVINNRGKPLSELEKIKNYLIYYASRHQASDLRKKINDCWPILLRSLNTAKYVTSDDENRFLRVCWIVFHDYNKTKSYHVYDNLKLVCPPESREYWRKLSDFVDFITSTARTYSWLFHSESSELTYLEIKHLQRISLHPANASILPLVVALYSKDSDPDRRCKILDILEKLNFRYYVTGIANRNDTGQGELFELAFNYYKGIFPEFENPNNLHISDVLYAHLLNFVNVNANDHQFVQYLTLDKNETGDYYKWQGIKYFLASYEDSLLERNRQASRLSASMASRDSVNPNDFYHLEHIWAAKDFEVVNDESDRDVNKRRLGNFILLLETINIRASNDRPEEKVELYFEDTKIQPNTLMIRELLQDFQKAQHDLDDSGQYQRKVSSYYFTLYKEFLDTREQRMINFAISRWRVEGLTRPVTSVIIDSKLDSNEVFQCLPEYDETNRVVSD